MSFHFECTRCREEIKVPEGTGGKKTRCPHCQAVIQIPVPQAAEPPRNPSRQPLSEQPRERVSKSSSPSSPMRSAVGDNTPRDPHGESFRELETENPYAAPSFQPNESGTPDSFAEQRLAEARQKLLIPSVIALIVITGSVLTVGLLVLGGVILVVDGEVDGVQTLLIMLGLLALQMPALTGVLSATFRWSYTLAWAGFICSLIPCTNACAGTVFPIAVGIWGMVALSDPAVRKQFRW